MAKKTIPSCNRCGKFIVPPEKAGSVRPEKVSLICKCDLISLRDVINESTLSEKDQVDESFNYLDRIEENNIKKEEENTPNPEVQDLKAVKNDSKEQMTIAAMRRGTLRIPSKPFAAILALIILGPFGSHHRYLGDKNKAGSYTAFTIISLLTAPLIVGLFGLIVIQVLCIFDGFKILGTSEREWVLKYGEIVDLDVFRSDKRR